MNNDMSVQVFLVDDERAVTDGLMWLLESVKIPSRSFDDADSFVQALRDVQGPVCAVLDLRMPGVSGLELQQRLADEGIDVPLIFLSAHGDVPAAVNAMQQGAVDFLQKPVNSQAFLNSINRIVRLARERFESKQHEDSVQQKLERLSARELEVLDGLLGGKTSKLMARDLNISPKTVDVHRASVMRKLLVSNSAELVKMVGPLRGSASNSRRLHPKR
jgi:two-component system, LuxR family, response regulator FixJ